MAVFGIMAAVMTVIAAATITMTAAVTITMGNTATIFAWRTVGRIGTTDFQFMLINMIGMWVVQVAIVKIVNMTIVLDGSMATVFAVGVTMVVVCIAAHNVLLLFNFTQK